MSVITLRIPKELKDAIKKHADVNWSEVVREAIVKKIEIEERLEAIKKIDEIKKRVKPVEKGQLDKWIRED
ncbi:MAG: hypothetical protein ACUVTD_07720 [Nitrososphaerales archaeon]